MLGLAGCVGILPQPAPSADLSAIRLPPGFTIEFYARDLGHARFLTLDPRGTLLVSVPRAGRVVALPDDDQNGRADAVIPVVEDLDLPHGLAFLDGQLYVAETGRVMRFDYDPAARRVRGGRDGRRPGPPVPWQPLDPEHRDRARSPPLRVGGVLVQQLRGARPPPRGDLQL